MPLHLASSAAGALQLRRRLRLHRALVVIHGVTGRLEAGDIACVADALGWFECYAAAHTASGFKRRERLVRFGAIRRHSCAISRRTHGVLDCESYGTRMRESHTYLLHRWPYAPAADRNSVPLEHAPDDLSAGVPLPRNLRHRHRRVARIRITDCPLLFKCEPETPLACPVRHQFLPDDLLCARGRVAARNKSAAYVAA